ncbi:YhdP family protein [Halorhodospira halochloris]|uniref:YhdP family phospholipid transporter n=1 Tax=Halorhodospira halochloris TaxID=1052 RepID=UPI001EE7B897|nr:AsmA-like C-terminal region-containing protein [Halorhodospira halochloris]MCG5548106.1 hypothetical protein [Halorhodospira halochloris]
MPESAQHKVIAVLSLVGKGLSALLLVLTATVLAVGIVLRSVAWLQLPLEEPLEHLLTKALEHPVTIDSARLSWDGVWPALDLYGLRLGEGDDRLEVGSLGIEVAKPPWYWAEQGPYGLDIYISDARVIVFEDEEKGWQLRGLPELAEGEEPIRLPANIYISAAEVQVSPAQQSPLAVSGIDVRLAQQGRQLKAGARVAGEQANLAKGISLALRASLDKSTAPEVFVGLDSVDVEPFLAIFDVGGISGNLNGGLWPVIEVDDDVGLSQRIRGVYGNLSVASSGIEPRNGLPGVGAVSAAASFQGRRFVAQAQLLDESIYLPEIFADPVPVNQARARFRGGLFFDGAWWVSLERGVFDSEVISKNVRGRLDYFPGQGPELLLYTSLIRPLQVTELVENIPPKVIPEPVYNWIEMAFLGGRLDGFEVLFQGNPADYPFTDNDGVFLAKSRFRDADLLYQEDWPLISEMDVDVNLDNLSLTVDGHRGVTCGAELYDVELKIDDLSKTVIDLYGRARGDAQDGICFLAESPIGRELLDDPPIPFAVAGPLKMDLDLWLPLTDAVEGGTTYRTGIDFHGVDFDFEQYLQLGDVKGGVEVDNQGLRDLELDGIWGGEEFSASAGLKTHDGRKRTVGEVTAHGSPYSLTGLIDADHLPWLEGKSAWNLRFIAPTFEPASIDPQLELSLNSSLQGLAIDMPQPFGLSKQEARELQLDATFTDVGLESYALHYADVLDLLAFAPEGTVPQALGIRLGGGAAELPNAGITIDGRLPVLDVDTWRIWLADNVGGGLADVGGDADGQTAEVDWHDLLPVNLNLTLGNLLFSGRNYGVQRIAARAARDGRGWFDLEGDLATGEAFWRDSGAHIRVNLDHLDVPLQGRTRVPDPAPKEVEPQVRDFPRLTPEDAAALPIFAGRIESLRLDGRHAGLAKLSLRPGDGKDYLAQGKITLRGKALDLQLQSHWREDCNVAQLPQCTDFEAVMLSADVARLLGLFGAPAAVVRAGVELDAKGQWPGSPLDFDLASLSGNLSLQMSDGRITEINPGAGRLVGLFGLRMLPRRVLLDFGDLFGDGLAFESVDGEFSLVGDGMARIDKMHIDSSAARVDMSGTVDYVARYYDAQVAVMPRVAATLPIFGLVFGGGAGGALGVMADWIIGGPMDRAASFVYRITGPWNEPQVQRVRP